MLGKSSTGPRIKAGNLNYCMNSKWSVAPRKAGFSTCRVPVIVWPLAKSNSFKIIQKMNFLFSGNALVMSARGLCIKRTTLKRSPIEHNRNTNRHYPI